ncbi:hypothetical protein [Pseudonocardia asaccharolytica]|uniref:Uncharacterized protein n=1 Tax=Pseudonocardia asaccharolytica DSM 44247 = NBRC 16224 TaxID=1123024 RepID=A0A511D0I8_9PSEU|nr:hypothetical protein [Pseudonocardia asaccharolytica]GEL18315.1 hypothetical protein PA7_21520 [Pseudonocardia asaccharolytica DSM 44247 = NBRC 16224]
MGPLPPETVSVTCCIDDRSHEVLDTELVVGSGYYRALCGHVITAASMTSPDGVPCSECSQLREPAPRRRYRTWR